jgi:hypothetical protein
VTSDKSVKMSDPLSATIQGVQLAVTAVKAGAAVASAVGTWWESHQQTKALRSQNAGSQETESFGGYYRQTPQDLLYVLATMGQWLFHLDVVNYAALPPARIAVRQAFAAGDPHDDDLGIPYESMDELVQNAVASAMVFCAECWPMHIWKGFGCGVFNELSWADPNRSNVVCLELDNSISALKSQPHQWVLLKKSPSRISKTDPQTQPHSKSDVKKAASLMKSVIEQFEKHGFPQPMHPLNYIKITQWWIPFATWNGNSMYESEMHNVDAVMMYQQDPGRFFWAWTAGKKTHLDPGEALLIQQDHVGYLAQWFEGLNGIPFRVILDNQVDYGNMPYPRKVRDLLKKHYGNEYGITGGAFAIVSDPNNVVRQVFPDAMVNDFGALNVGSSPVSEKSNIPQTAPPQYSATAQSPISPGGIAFPHAAMAVPRRRAVPKPPPAAVKVVIATHDFAAESGEELSFSAGASIDILDDTAEDGWWKGRIGDKTGLIPSTFVRELQAGEGKVAVVDQVKPPQEAKMSQVTVETVSLETPRTPPSAAFQPPKTAEPAVTTGTVDTIVDKAQQNVAATSMEQATIAMPPPEAPEELWTPATAYNGGPLYFDQSGVAHDSWQPYQQHVPEPPAPQETPQVQQPSTTASPATSPPQYEASGWTQVQIPSSQSQPTGISLERPPLQHAYTQPTPNVSRQSTIGEAMARVKTETQWQSAEPAQPSGLWNVNSAVATPQPTLIRIFHGHTKTVNAVAFCPTSTLLASGASDNTIRLWDTVNYAVATQRLLTGHDMDVESLCFSPDGQVLASGSMDNSVKLWDVRTGANLHTLKDKKNTSTVHSVAFSPDGRLLATAMDNNKVQIWDGRSLNVLRTIADHKRSVHSVAFSPDGQTLVTGANDKTVRTFNTHTGQSKLTIKAHPGMMNYVKTVSYSPNGKLIASGAFDSTVKLWDADSGAAMRTLECGNLVSGLAFSPDGRTIVSITAFGSLIFWSEDGVELHKLQAHDKSGEAVAFSRDGSMVATGSADHQVKLWKVNRASN